MKRLGYFVVLSLLAWALAAVPARHLWGDSALVFSATALGLCLVPAALTLAWAAWAYEVSPEKQLVVIFGATGVRMFFVLACALVLYLYVPYFQQQQAFLVWLLVCYLFTLALETGLVVKGRLSAGPPPSSAP
jgi:hypothetical protein